MRTQKHQNHCCRLRLQRFYCSIFFCMKCSITLLNIIGYLFLYVPLESTLLIDYLRVVQYDAVQLPFVTLGHTLASKYDCWITPAKWQAKGGAKNEDFRKNIVPYMSKIIYYPNSGDVFDIIEKSGMCFLRLFSFELAFCS